MSFIYSIKTFFPNQISFINSINSIQMINILFSLSISNSHGGAVFIDSPLINVSLFLCTFDKCQCVGNGLHGGGIAIKQSNSIFSNSCCFYFCNSFRCPGFLFWGSLNTGYQINHVEFNFSNEYNPFITSAASACYSKGILNFYQNNISSLSTNDISSGIYISSPLNMKIGVFNNLFNISGPHFFGIGSNFNNNNLILFDKINFIKCFYLNPKGFFWFASILSLKFNNSIFINCISTKMIYKHVTTSSIITFENCYFNFEENINNFENCVLKNCNFNINQNLNSFDILNTNLCWILSSNYFTSNFNNIKIKFLFISFLISFNNLI